MRRVAIDSPRFLVAQAFLPACALFPIRNRAPRQPLAARYAPLAARSHTLFVPGRKPSLCILHWRRGSNDCYRVRLIPCLSQPIRSSRAHENSTRRPAPLRHRPQQPSVLRPSHDPRSGRRAWRTHRSPLARAPPCRHSGAGPAPRGRLSPPPASPMRLRRGLTPHQRRRPSRRGNTHLHATRSRHHRTRQSRGRELVWPPRYSRKSFEPQPLRKPSPTKSTIANSHARPRPPPSCSWPFIPRCWPTSNPSRPNSCT